MYGTTPRRYGASSQIASGSAERRLTADDLRVLDALKLVAPLMVAGNDRRKTMRGAVAAGQTFRLGARIGPALAG
jgi:hypothetical protein